LLRDDKSYPYILITNQHPFPRIDIYRGQRKKNGLYFGPYPSAFAVRETISLLQKVFRLRTCRDPYFDSRTRPCLLYQIARCTAPCVGYISKEDYAHYVNLAVRFLQGKSNEVIDELQQKMEAASLILNFETAGQFRDQINRLRQIQDRQYVNVAEGNADAIGFAREGNVICIQLLSIRGGQVLGSRSYFPHVPTHASQEEIIRAFLSQHYFNHPSHLDAIPRQVIISGPVPDQDLLANVLSEQSQHKVEIVIPARGEKKKWLDIVSASAKQSLASQLFSQSNVLERARSLQKSLGLQKLPKRIECFDVSHSSGEATVAACVVFGEEGPIKSDYRRFNITGITPGDDIAAMHQVLLRRFKRLQREQGKFPDIVLIDGGPTQLSAALKVMDELAIKDIFFIGVAKGVFRKPGLETLYIKNQPPINLPRDSHALHFIQQIRDEAHRFAITGHRNRRDKGRRQSTLEAIPGIGIKRRRDLLRYFGGIQGVLHASLDELTKVPGISRSLAERIFATFHDSTI
jgi:excinuclease ABC subunit C